MKIVNPCGVLALPGFSKAPGGCSDKPQKVFHKPHLGPDSNILCEFWTGGGGRVKASRGCPEDTRGIRPRTTTKIVNPLGRLASRTFFGALLGFLGGMDRVLTSTRGA